MDIATIYDGPDACTKCLGWKRVANSDSGESWKYWAELRPPENLTVQIGIVHPIMCPRCNGTGQESPAISDGQVRAAIAVLSAYADRTLSTDLCDELDEAIERAWLARLADEPPDDERGDYETPLTQSW